MSTRKEDVQTVLCYVIKEIQILKEDLQKALNSNDPQKLSEESKKWSDYCRAKIVLEELQKKYSKDIEDI